ncbi:major facilitator superfamily domain-containing protein [Talaromyces proteolyticus]|uniref:Major facilitator superfamily domain-containing protein n=1 Tax=Talaromyces proteolyticus TaxID=1131652 RepID=A0AAD4L599_9EURO|nr:major facilitator superfamily domain-containing protein [Talaromyces proteolyticus]KAH8705331.1 major facilitator superfamily domain-containing protein [Talaromyces proteolyticus]
METTDIEDLPGTSRLLSHGQIILSPPPTKSVNDPLNWPKARKYWHAILVCFIAGFTAATSNDAGSAQFGENDDLGISYAAMNTGAGVLFLGIGYGTLLLSPAAWLWGRRITYLFCITMGLIGAIWMAKTQSTSDSIWNQLFVGISESCAEANVQLSLSDLFYEHQRGTFLGVYVLATSVGTYLGPLIAGFIGDSNLGWRWIGWWAVSISVGTVITFFFTLEETMFDRDAHETKPIICSQEPTTDPETAPCEKKPETPGLFSNEIVTAEEQPRTYWQRIALITPASNLVGFGFRQYSTRLVHTMRIFSFPAVIYSGIQWGVQDAWLTFYLTVEDDNWSDAPWYYGDVGVGLINLPCLIGAVLGCFYGGYFSDLFMIWMAKRNGGIREAEHRLWFLFPLAIIGPLGMLLFGIGTGQGWSWPGPYVGLGLIGFGWGCTGDLSMAYLMDAYPEMVLEGMVGVSVINNSIACILTFTASMWLDSQGVQNTFIVIAALDFFFVMTTVPMIIWGKNCRRWTKSRYLEFVRIRDSF